MLLCSFLDKPVFVWCTQFLTAHPDLPETDFIHTLRSIGFLPVWFVVAGIFFLLDCCSTNARRTFCFRGGMLLLGTLTSGACGEGLKLLVRRLRPNETQGEYIFRAFTDHPFKSNGFGMPSSHAVIAFAAVWILCRLHPRAAPIFILLAIGCGVTRILSTAHFLSDVYAAALLSYAVVWLYWQWHLANERAFFRKQAQSAEPQAH
jgi:membrane-associated phospholipid phosphatase